ncbi:MAG: ferrous iron transport protein B [Candidatus Eisenbacteria bacterium]|uniref:Ferrous iron transport protein B n=1 Tax=Eiseniibacteriota bacterium TaxID=2212470 RepID=A0A956NGP6_UNCEI|nr:ferrous iron transport protein B [Candidatus Eisenbacteria bacterium]
MIELTDAVRTKVSAPRPSAQHASIALIGNPNAGKTSLFNRITGMRARTANFSGTTVEHREAPAILGPRRVQFIDLPGLYSLDAVTLEEQVARAALTGELEGATKPDVVVLVVDATRLERNLFLASQVLELQRPTLLALNMMDEARRLGIQIDLQGLAEEVGCKVLPVSARTGEGVDALQDAIGELLDAQAVPKVDSMLHACDACGGCRYAARYHWAERVADRSVVRPATSHGQMTESIDRILTHPIAGILAVAAVMTVLFLLIFWIAQYPMEMIDGLFTWASETVARFIPSGDFQSLIVDGVIPGVGGMLVFLPQIVLLFFLLALLEDSGYMARAAFVMDKLMHKVGLPGKAFVPMLSGHACAIPAIMSTRVIEDHRDRLATILVVPLMSCSARVPVYAMVIALLFPKSPLQASLTFVGAYSLGVVAALVAGFVLKRTILKGQTRAMVIELPNYRMPNLRDAVLLTLDRAWVFVKNAGTIILAISVGLWVLATYPKTDTAALDSAGHAPAAAEVDVAVSGSGAGAGSGSLSGADAAVPPSGNLASLSEAEVQRVQLENSALGRIGHFIEPVFRPLGFNWEIGIGVLTSFAAREVIVSTLAVVYGLGEDGAEGGSLYDALRASKWPDGTPVFGFATCLSLLVFYVLAMQCLPTNAVTRRETRSWKWPLFQIGYMSVLAYGAAFVTYHLANWFVG